MRILAGIGMALALGVLGFILILTKKVEPPRPAVMAMLLPGARLFLHRWFRCLVGAACILAAVGVLIWVVVDPG